MITEATAVATRQVWQERDGGEPPTAIPSFPVSWPARYERLAVGHGLGAVSFVDATAAVERLWAEMFPGDEG